MTYIKVAFAELSYSNLTYPKVTFAELSQEISRKKGFTIQKDKEYFTRFPNEYIQGDIRTKFGVSRKFYIVYILIDRYRSYEDYSWLTIRKVLNFYGYKTTKRKPKSFTEILDVLEYMVNNKMIQIEQDLDSIGYDTGIEIKINPSRFDYPDYFTKITSSQLDVIMMSESSLNRESLLMAFLYIKSYIGCRPKYSDSGTEMMSDPETRPEAFWKSLENMSRELSMSKDTLAQCMEFLTTSTESHNALLVKKEVGSIKPNKNKPPINAPNIYVINKDGYEKEIELAYKKMCEVYGVDMFDNMTGGVKNS